MKDKKSNKSKTKIKGGKNKVTGTSVPLDQLNKKGRELLLRQAAAVSDVDGVKRLLNMGTNPNCDAKKVAHLPLLIACFHGHVEIVKLLLASGADVNLTDTLGQSPLFFAIESGSIDVVGELLESGADVHHLGKTRFNALMQACGQGHLEIVAMLLERGADINGNVPGEPAPLSIAVMKGHTAVVKMLLERGAETEGSGPRSVLALTKACIKGDLEMTRLLLEYGANPSPKDFLVSPLWAAACNGHLAIVDELLRHDVNIDVVDRTFGRSPLMMACTNEFTTVARRLIDHGANPNLENSHGATPLFYAVEREAPETVRLLLENGAAIEHRDHDGDTALTVACVHGHAEVVEMLLRAGARHDVALPDGTSPLQIAKEEGHHEVVELLKRYGAIDPAEQAKEQKEWQELVTTEFFQSVRSGNLNSIDAALSAGADINCRNPEGETALVMAVEGGAKKVVSYLISKGAHVNRPNLRSGHTALDKALHKRREDLFDILLEEGAHVEDEMLLGPSGSGNIKWVNKLLSCGCTPYGECLTAAIQGQHIQIVQLLLSKGVTPDAWDYRAQATALMLAARKGRLDIVRCLLEAGADIDLMGHNRRTALMEAAKAGQSEVVRLLVDDGADLEIKDGNGRTALDLAKKPEIKEILKPTEAQRHH